MNILNFASIFIVVVSIPGSDLTSGGTEITQNQNIVLNLIKLANDYVWFFLFFIAMGVLTRGGIMLFLSEGDASYIKKANLMIVYGLIGIMISISSYFIVKLLVNLF